MPSGGNCGAWIGSIDGGAVGQTLGGQMGGISSALLHRGTFSPFVHRHTQSALASEKARRVTRRTRRFDAWRTAVM